jgi:hypothetical protein
MLSPLFAIALPLLQQPGAFLGATSPPSGDTVGYWQQRIGYTIVATLDETQNKLRSRGTLIYVNNSPDTLREMYFHQYLNAFRPGSKWSESDERENRVRFQNLAEPNFGYERFTVGPLVNGSRVTIDYPGSPDSTVARIQLPAALRPRDSVRITFEWDARPSTVFRRQGRRGRTWDFAQWYPKVAVYDRGGWKPNALVPAGELYGEYGTYDVTLVVRDDQILASTGVPVSGDPGWERVSRTGPPFTGSGAYSSVPQAADVAVPPGYRAVRWIARDVHHFAWSASPDYRYEGATYTRPAPSANHQVWDTVAVNVLYKPGDDTTWGGRRAVDRTITAMRWLESIWGPYAYPQITNVHRLDGGGTEFPMMIMDGSASQGLILHELGHVFTYGILGNNEWRSGWLDEGLSDYQTDWAQNLSAQERARVVPPPQRLAEGYRVNAAIVPRADSVDLGQWQLEILGRAEPIGTNAAEFSEFGIYNYMIYDRAKAMYSHLRDVMGDSVFRAFMRGYYGMWALKHVDERAMRAAAARAYGRDLGWFFDQWVHGTGLLDYALGQATSSRRPDGYWVTRVPVSRRGELKHPMPVGVRTGETWTITHATSIDDEQTVEIVSIGRPDAVVLDPLHYTWDWDWRNNTVSTRLGTIPAPRVTFNWPALDQSDRLHTIVALSPLVWYSDPQGISVGVRARTNYLSIVDKHDGGIAFSTRTPVDSAGRSAHFTRRLQFWARAENLSLPGLERPLMGYSGSAALLDGIVKLDLSKSWDLSPFYFARGPSIGASLYATGAYLSEALLVPEQWSPAHVTEVGGSVFYRSFPVAENELVDLRASVGAGFSNPAFGTSTESSHTYSRTQVSIGVTRSIIPGSQTLSVRAFGGLALNAPRQRAIYASTEDPFSTFENNFYRPRGALLKQEGGHFLPIGGAGLRGFSPYLPLERVGAANVELSQKLFAASGEWGQGTIWLSGFGDAGFATSRHVDLPDSFLSDAGVGFLTRATIYDRPLVVRLDFPIVVNHASLAGGKARGNGSVAVRWVFSLGNLWR